jgi:polar amino acid transport system substrate-binding protein
VQKDEALAKLVPSDVASDGKIVVGSDASYAPNEFVDTDGTTIIGMDVDLGKAIGQKLGLEVEFQNSAFDGILPGIAAKKYDLGMSSFTDNADREKVVDMVTYFSAGTKMATLKGNPDGINLDDLCGKTIAVQRGTVQVDDLTARSDKCTAAGKPGITQQPFQAQTDVTLALTGKRAQGMLADSPVVDYAVAQTNGQLEAVGEAYDTAPYGVAVPKGDGKYAQAIQGAMQALMTDGTYKTILEKWSVAGGAITTSKINGAAG